MSWCSPGAIEAIVGGMLTSYDVLPVWASDQLFPIS